MAHSENDASSNSSIVACVFVSTEPLSSNDSGIFTDQSLATIGGGGYIDTHTHTDSNVIS
jgi:hypothetical protein